MPALTISIHAAREGGDELTCAPKGAVAISIHAAREGGDRFDLMPLDVMSISIHAAREGGDDGINELWTTRRYFNPRRP